jgi:hypothetical protein
MWLFLMMFGPQAGLWSLASTLATAPRETAPPLVPEP